VQHESAQQRPHYDNERRELQSRLAEALRRLALSPKEIESLPDNYAQAVASGAFAKDYDPAHRERAFPHPDLFDGSWIYIDSSPEEFNSGGVAPSHVQAFSGRSRRRDHSHPRNLYFTCLIPHSHPPGVFIHIAREYTPRAHNMCHSAQYC
jgi:hypothetical protein